MGRVETAAADQNPNPGQHHHEERSTYHPQNPQTFQSPYMGVPLGVPFESGLFDCHLDQTNAVMTAFFPCVTFGQIAEVLDATDPSPATSNKITCPLGSASYLASMLVCANCFLGSSYRKKLRDRYGLVEAPYDDAISHLFCPCCSLCQEFRQLKKLDLDPALGWKGIVARQQMMQYQHEMMKTPPQHQAMSK